LREGTQWISLKAGFQKPPETVLEVEKIKIFLGEHPQTSQVNEHFTDEKTLRVSLPPLNSTIVAFAPL
jgi:hypothetical protein